MLNSLYVTISSVDRTSNYDFQYQTFCPFYYEASSILRLRLEGKEAPRVSQDIQDTHKHRPANSSAFSKRSPLTRSPKL